MNVKDGCALPVCAIFITFLEESIPACFHYVCDDFMVTRKATKVTLASLWFPQSFYLEDRAERSDLSA